MNRLIIAAIAALLVPVAASAAPAASERERLLTIEARWNKAISDRDAVTAGAIISDDFRYVTPNGTVMDRAAVLAATASKDYVVDPFITEDVEVRFHGPTAVVTGRFTQTGSFKGQRFSVNMRYTDVWVRSGRTWRAISAHSSLIR